MENFCPCYRFFFIILGEVFIFPRNAKRRQDFSCRQFVVGLPCREAVKPPLFVPVFRDRLNGELGDGKPIGFDPGVAGISAGSVNLILRIEMW